MERRQKSREELILVATDRNAAIGNWSEFFNIAEHSFGMKSLFASNFSLVIRPRSDRLFVCCKIANGQTFSPGNFIPSEAKTANFATDTISKRIFEGIGKCGFPE